MIFGIVISILVIIILVLGIKHLSGKSKDQMTKIKVQNGPISQKQCQNPTFCERFCSKKDDCAFCQ